MVIPLDTTPDIAAADRTSEYLGRHPFKVRVYAGPEMTPLYVGAGFSRPAIQQMGMHGPGFGVLDLLRARGVSWLAVRAAMDRCFTLPFTSMLAMLATIPREQLFSGPQMIRQYVRDDIQPGQFQSDWALIALLKAAIEQAGMVGPDFLPAAALEFLRSPAKKGGPEYGQLADLVGRVSKRPGDSERRVSARPALRSLELWFVKEGDLSVIFRADAELADGSHARWVLNVAKDRPAAERQQAIHRDLHLFSQRDPRVMVPYGVDRVKVLPRVFRSLGLPAAHVTVSAGEWLDGFDELHLYPGDTCFHVWTDQRNAETTTLSREVSDRIWREIVQLHVHASGIARGPFRPLWTHINAGDFVVSGRLKSAPTTARPDIRLIGMRGAPDETDPSPASYVMSLLLIGAVDDHRGPAQTIWWGDPDAAIDAVTSALTADGMEGDAIQQLLRKVRDETLPALIRVPASYPGYAALNERQRGEFARLAELTRERLRAD